MKKNKKTIDKKETGFQWKKGEKALFLKRKTRFEKMYKRKERLGIDNECDRFDALFTPHLITLDNGDVQTNQSFMEDKLFTEKQRKSTPIFFEKVTTAQSLLIKENPKGRMKPYGEKYRNNALIVENTYYDNFSQQNKKEVLKKYIYQLSKYGIAYWREYIKKTYRKQHIVNENGETQVKWVYDVNDVVGEVIHPKFVILDDDCYGVKDVNKPARDLIIINLVSKDVFDSIYPAENYENAQYIKEGGPWMLDLKNISSFSDDEDIQSKIQILTYENKFENIREVWVNSMPMESIPLPGDELSLSGDKWISDKDNYKGIGLGHVVELYQPIIDDIITASNERLRQIVRPNEDHYDDIEQSDESEDVLFGSASVRKFNGTKGNVVYTTPPARTDAEVRELEEMKSDLDLATSVPRRLGGDTTNSAKTAYQDAMQRESALQKLNLPLGSIKNTIEQAANLDLALYQIAYSEPIETLELLPGDEDFSEGISILEQAEKNGVDDERVAVLEYDQDGKPSKIARRNFRILELPLKAVIEQDENDQTIAPTVKVIESEELNFWENIPKHFNWKGRIEIIGDSFLPVSKTLEDTQDKETIEYLMNVPTTDEMGRPTLTDADGKPFTIDKVRLVKERTAMNKNFDPEKFIVPLNQENQGQGVMDNANPLESTADLNAGNIVGTKRPELGNIG